MSRRSASPAEDAIHDLLQTMSQKERDARYDAKHKQLCVSVSRALENAAWTLDEFCNNDADRQTVWTEISDGAQRMLAQLVAAGAIVGIARGRSEHGPRALGHRSLFADATSPRAKARLNRLKYREAWRPVAPIVAAAAAPAAYRPGPGKTAPALWPHRAATGGAAALRRWWYAA